MISNKYLEVYLDNLLDAEYPAPICSEKGTAEDGPAAVTNSIENHHHGTGDVIVVQRDRVGEDNTNKLERA